MILPRQTHKVQLAVFAAVFALAVWAILSERQSPTHLPIAIWTALGAVASLGAVLEILSIVRTRKALERMKTQIRALSQKGQLGLVMLEDDLPVAGLANIVNSYLTVLKSRFDELTRQHREMDLVLGAVDAEKQNTEAVIRSISDAVMVLNAFGEVLLANRAAERVFGFELSEHDRPNVDQIIEAAGVVELIGQAESSGHTQSRELWFETAESEHRCFQITVCPVFIAGDSLWAVVVTLHDVTRDRELAAMKDNFVNHVSHELKTPLTSIVAYAELLTDDELTDRNQTRQCYRVISSEARRLERLVNAILDINKIEAGVMPFDPQPMDVRTELDHLRDLTCVWAEEKQIALSIEVPPEMTVYADRDLLHQAILNLISNALKYTSSGGTVTVRARVDEASDCDVIEVVDTGVGIAEDERQRIFQPFYRGAGAARLARGTGLGLELALKIVEKIHSGTLQVTSTPGRGSTFSIHLPRQETVDPLVPADASLTS